MSTINFSRKKLCKQRVTDNEPGFLVIELLQGLLILGVLLLLVSAFHVLSVHWQHQAIRRLEALDALTSELTYPQLARSGNTVQALEMAVSSQKHTIPELTSMLGKTVEVEQKIARATWKDERGKQHVVRISS